MNQFIIKTLSDINRVASEFLSHYPNARIFAFRGGMGIGKTTFIKALCENLGVSDTVNSPSFAIINEYKTSKDDTVFHFDFYRLKNINEAYDMGYEDYFYSGAYCFIEWPDKIEELLPENMLELIFTEGENHQRIISVR